MKTLEQHIEITPGISGGKPRIAGHRITVENIVIWHERMGKSADEIATEYDLTLADVYAALAYYFDHRAEIDQSIEESEVFVKTLRQQTFSKLSEKPEIIFEVIEDEIDNGYSASALGYGIHTEGDTLEALRRNVKEAVECYFDATMKRPGLIRLHFVRDESLWCEIAAYLRAGLSRYRLGLGTPILDEGNQGVLLRKRQVT